MLHLQLKLVKLALLLVFIVYSFFYTFVIVSNVLGTLQKAYAML